MMRFILGDWGLKVVALLIAWSMWFLVRESLQQEEDVVLHVRLDTPAELVAEAQPGYRTVKVKVKGSRAAMARFLAMPERSVTVRVDASRMEQGKHIALPTFAYDSQDVVFPGPIQSRELLVQSYDPPEGIKATVWRIVEKTVTVEPPRLEDDKVPGVRVVVRRRHHDNAVIRGKSEALSTLLSIPTVITEQAIEAAKRELGTRSGDVLVVPVDIDVERLPVEFTLLEPADGLKADLRIEKTTTHVVEVPVLLLYRDQDERRLRAADERNKLVLSDIYMGGSPPKLKIELRGDETRLQGVDPAAINLHVRTWEWQPEKAAEPVRVHFGTLPEGVELVKKAGDYKLFLEPVR